MSSKSCFINEIMLHLLFASVYALRNFELSFRSYCKILSFVNASDVCACWATPIVWEMVVCARISSTASSVTRLVGLADPNCSIKTSLSATWSASTSLHSSGKHFPANRNRWRVSLSYCYSLSDASYTEKIEEAPSSSSSRRYGPSRVGHDEMLAFQCHKF